MPSLRDIRRKARRDVHEQSHVPAVYLLAPNDPIGVTVRLHRKMSTGDVGEGGGPGWATQLDVEPRMVFKRDEVSSPQWGAMVMYSQDEGYFVEASHPPDDEFVSASVKQMSATEAQANWDPSFEEFVS